MKVIKHLWIVFFLVNIAFADESPLLPGSKIVAGDPGKNEFFILGANEKIPESQPAVKSAPVMVANNNKQTTTTPKKAEPKEENNFALRAKPEIKMAFNNHSPGKISKPKEKNKEVMVAKLDKKSDLTNKASATKRLNQLTNKTVSQLKIAINKKAEPKVKSLKTLDKTPLYVAENTASKLRASLDKKAEPKVKSLKTLDKTPLYVAENTASKIKVAFDKKYEPKIKSIHSIKKNSPHLASKNIHSLSKVKKVIGNKLVSHVVSMPEIRLAFSDELHQKANQKLFNQMKIALKKSSTKKSLLVSKNHPNNTKLAANHKKSKKPVKLYISYKSIYLKKSVHKIANIKKSTKVRMAQQKIKSKQKRVIT